MDYEKFLDNKTHLGGNFGFKPVWMPDFLFDFQKYMVEWSLLKGRGALFEDCGLGKTPQSLVWAENVVRKTNKPVLILTPLAVSQQFVIEGQKFGIECHRSQSGKIDGPSIYVTNYERLHHFDSSMFSGVVCDESSILKNFDGKTKSAVTDFMRKTKYRLLGTATASPNDYIELGTSSEALGDLGYMDMLGMFFKNDGNTSAHGGAGSMPGKRFSKSPFDSKWRFKPHAEVNFWRWVCSWARSCRKPSDIGFSDENFVLPPLVERETIVNVSRPMGGFLFPVPARGLKEQRAERRHTLKERCEAAAEKIIAHGESSIAWCHLNDEADLLEEIIPHAYQVSGTMPDYVKEERMLAFQSGQIKRLVIKPVIGGFGLNWQHCHHMTMFPAHSFEQYYQSIRRCLRFGQKKAVLVDVITTEGEDAVLKNIRRKAAQAEQMFAMLVKYMSESMKVSRVSRHTNEFSSPSWIGS